MTYGQKLMRVDYGNGRDDVTQTKEKFAELVDMMDDLRQKSTDGEVKRLTSAAITQIQQAKFWVVDALCENNNKTN